MTREIEGYLIILETFIDELRQPIPNETVLHNCRLFLTEAPLPVQCPLATTGEFGHA